MRDTSFYTGEIVDTLPSATFKVKLDDLGTEVICHLSGKIRINNIRCILGDKVEVVLSPDKRLGRIVRRK